MYTQDPLTSPEVRLQPWHRIRTKDKVLLYTHLSNLVEGGITTMNALKSFLDKTRNPRMWVAARDMLGFLAGGDAFSTAMKKVPGVFTRGEIAVIEAGEQSGNLQNSFLAIAEELRTSEDLRAQVKSAMAYPLIVVGFLIAAIGVVMVYIIPKLEPLFVEANITLPLATAMLIGTSRFLNDHFVLIILAIILAWGGFMAYSKTLEGQRKIDSIRLKTPVLGDVYRHYCLSRIGSSFGMLMSAGIPILKTIRLTAEGVGNVLYAEALERVAENVTQGRKLVDSFEAADPEKKLFLSDFVQLIGVGEQTSTVNRIAKKLADQYHKEVERSLNTLVKLVEPAAILVTGLFVLWFALAIFSAIIKITDSVG